MARKVKISDLGKPMIDPLANPTIDAIGRLEASIDGLESVLTSIDDVLKSIRYELRNGQNARDLDRVCDLLKSIHAKIEERT